jgi:hypothetical protein
MTGGADAASLVRSKRDMHTAIRERDDALFKLEQAEREIGALRVASKEAERLKVLNVQLQQDIGSLQISFDSSERIRKQQKDLINLLQRSQALDSGGSAHSGFMDTSNHSLNGTTKEYDMSERSIAELNRSWLNSVPDNDFVNNSVRKSLGSSMKLAAHTSKRLPKASVGAKKNSEFSRTRATNPTTKRNIPSADARLAAGMHVPRTTSRPLGIGFRTGVGVIGGISSGTRGERPPRPHSAQEIGISSRKAVSAKGYSNGNSFGKKSTRPVPVSAKASSSYELFRPKASTLTREVNYIPLNASSSYSTTVIHCPCIYLKT